jgi:hypothetical protein
MDAAERRLAVMLVSLTEDIKFIRKKMEATGFSIGACCLNKVQNMGCGPKDMAIHRMGIRASCPIRSIHHSNFEPGRCTPYYNRGRHGIVTTKRGYNTHPTVQALPIHLIPGQGSLIC